MGNGWLTPTGEGSETVHFATDSPVPMRSASTTAYVPARPRYGLFDVIGLLFRELLVMILVFVLVLALGAAAVMTLKKTYTSGASLLVNAGQEYVYQPRVGGLADRQSQPPAVGEVAQVAGGDRLLP